jgi:hypothetical protein
MTSLSWRCVEFVSHLLEPDEREAVLGDVAEADESFWQGLLGVLTLFFSRQLALLRDWRPWLAGFGVTLPCSFLLTGVSLSVTCTFERLVLHKVLSSWLPTGHEDFAIFACHIFLLIAWAWTSGFLVGWLSRGTLWLSAALCIVFCLLRLSLFHFESVSRYSMILFLLPAILGVRFGLRRLRIPLVAACLLAVVVTVLMISAWQSNALWILNWALLCPVWYLVATARKRATSFAG